MSFPASDFTRSIQTLHDTWSSVPDLGGSTWQDVSIANTQVFNAAPYLRLRKCSTSVPQPTKVLSSTPEPEPELLEEDPEALIASLPQKDLNKVVVTYDILHSPTYLVPTIYITLAPPPSSPSQLYDLLVPALLKPTLQKPAIGVLGGLSATTHPETCRSCYWVHPCLTQEAMQGLGLRAEDGTAYLMGWLGIVGSGVGMDVPLDVARKVMHNRPESGTKREA